MLKNFVVFAEFVLVHWPSGPGLKVYGLDSPLVVEEARWVPVLYHPPLADTTHQASQAVTEVHKPQL